MRGAFLVFSLVRVPTVCQIPLWKRELYLERSQQTSDCNCFSCQKNTQSSAEALTAVPCHEENSSTSKQRSIYPYHILCSGGVRNLSIILKTVHNFKELYQEARVSDFFSFLFWHFDTVLLRRKEKIIIDRPISSMSRGRLNKRVLFQFL